MFQVKIVDYKSNEKCFIKYQISNLDIDLLKYLDENLVDETNLEGDLLFLTTYFHKNFYPFKSDDAHLKINEYIAREEIEMLIYISGFLEEEIK